MKDKEIKKFKKRAVKNYENVWDKLNKKDKEKAFKFAEEYKKFLNEAKTEREAVKVIKKIISESKNTSDLIVESFRNKTLVITRKGKNPITDGINMIISHIDSPRLDLKQNPLYENTNLAFLKSHYYGGIKKFHWVNIPLSIHGVLIDKNRNTINISIGELDDDPVFTIADILPHLSHKVQDIKTASKAVEAEKLNLIVGSMPIGNDKVSNRFKLNVLKLLEDQYKLCEEDFVSAELEIVPSFKARDIGFDRSLIGAYGQDDKICAFTSLKAIINAKQVDRTSLVLFVDKEEIGSDGATGAKSEFIKSFISKLIKKDTNKDLFDVLINSRALSADVNGSFDPDYPEVHEATNAAVLGHGICITKFTGSGGKFGSNDADAEYVGFLRKLFNDNKIIWQTGELGKIDEGGGGTIAKYLANYGMEMVDCGPSILSMHSPFEISNKGDVFISYKTYKTFLES